MDLSFLLCYTLFMHITQNTGSLFKIVRIGNPLPSILLDTPRAVYDFYKSHIASLEIFDPEREALYAIALNTKNNTVGYSLISIGILNETLFHPRETFRFAVLQNAYGVIMIHNHPSGNPTPSNADLSVTKRSKQAGEILEINLLDHVIIGSDATPFYSFREYGLL